ncbi:MAG: hypothetical protein Q9214_005393 [Letrouitia sp. 1 TL-2023]
MLSLSIHEAARKTAWTCIACSALSRTPQGLITSLPLNRSASKHYRKHSSSKASSSSKDEARPISSASESPNNDQAAVGKRSSSRFGRRSSKDVSKISGKSKNEFHDLPSLAANKQQDIHVASFFSNHRPISVTTSFPPASSEVAFSSMFTPQTSSRQKPSDVIYTISSAVDSLENATALRQQPNSDEAELRSVLSETELSDPHPDHKLLDASLQQQNVHIDVQELIKTFRPFVAPPPPIPMERSHSLAPQEHSHSAGYRGLPRNPTLPSLPFLNKPTLTAARSGKHVQALFAKTLSLNPPIQRAAITRSSKSHPPLDTHS